MNNQNMKKTILVTGAAGNIGSALVCKLCKEPNNLVIGIDNLTTGQKIKLPLHKDWRYDNFIFIKADVNVYSEISSIFFRYKVDYLFHFAAVVGVKRTLENPISVLEDITGIKNVLNLSKNTGVKKVFYSSSSEVYGEPVSIPQNEYTTPLNSRLPYAIVKNIGEAFFKSYYEEHDLNYTIFRYFNTYGPNQSTDFVVPKFLKAALAGEDITIYGDGLQTRTFCYIDDNIDTMLIILDKNLLGNDVINIGSDIEITIKALGELIIEMCGSKSKLIHLPPLKDGDMTRRLPDISRMKSILGRDLIPIKQGLHRLIEHNKF
jgi:UDP-glucuronate decarboxylase